MKRLENQVAIVAGGSGGIGSEIVNQLLSEGSKVVSVDITEPKKNISNNNLLFKKFDSTDINSWKKIVKITLKNFKKINFLINCFGTNFRKEFDDQSLDEWQKIIDVNLTGVFLGIKSVVPFMKKEKIGSIINFGSIVTLRGGVNGPAYQASKTGLIGLTRSTALAYASDNIRCNMICPGHVDTDFIRENNLHSPNDWSTSIKNPLNYEKRKKGIPLNDFQEVQDIANLAIFLCSNESKMITGTIIPVDGGSTI